MIGNYDITIQSLAGEITFYGSKRGENNELNYTGYTSQLDFLGDPGRRTTSTVKSGADGGLVVPTDQQYEMRQISLDAFAMCDTIDSISAVTASIRAAMPIRETVLVLVTTPQGNKFGTRAVVTKCTPSLVYSDGTRLLRDYALELLAPDPYWYDYNNDNLNTVELTKVIPGGLEWAADGLHWNTNGLPWKSGSGNTTIVNSGDEVFPAITITGVVHNPIITNLTTNQQFQLNISTSESDIIVTDMDAETVTLKGSTIMNNITTKNWWGLETGNNTISYNSATDLDTAQVVMTWRNRYMEII